MKVLVTGASGFIGRAVCAHMRQAGHFVYALNSGAEPITECDVYLPCNLGQSDKLAHALEGELIDCCVHLAWTGLPDYTYGNSWSSMQNSFNLLEAGNRGGIKHFIYAGSCFEYLNPAGAVSEMWPIKNTDAYAASKAGVLGLARQYCKEQNLSFHWLRFFYVIGPGQKKDSLIPYVVQSLKAGQAPKLRTAYNENDFIDARDVAAAVMAVMEKNPAEAGIFNVGSGHAVPIWKVVEEAAHILGFADELEFAAHPPEISFYADTTRIRELTSWIPRIDLPQSIRDVINSLSLDVM